MKKYKSGWSETNHGERCADATDNRRGIVVALRGWSPTNHSLGAAIVSLLFFLISGCAQIGAPTGGPKDITPPVLLRATPSLKSTSFTGNKIVLQFNEYINLQDVQNEVLFSPYQKIPPVITFNFKTVTVKLKDSLQPRTTYTINFGNAIRDLNEGNPLGNFVYTFSTGAYLDSMTLKGKVILAENGTVDSSLLILLYKDLSDTAVLKRKPDYISKVKGDGSFTFENLPVSNFNVFALKDGDNSKTYNSKTETFAFADSVISLQKPVSGILLYAYAQEKVVSPAKVLKPTAEKKLRYSTNLTALKQDILDSLRLTFNNPVKVLSDTSVLLTDTLFKPLSFSTSFDSTRKVFTISNKWKPATKYVLLVKRGLTDSASNVTTRNDTLRFTTNATTDYGRVVLRFKNLDLDRHPVIQLMQNDKLIISHAITSAEWKNDLVPPGEYEIMIIYDTNQNGKWDPGNYEKKKQPEKAIILPQKLAIRADWDNERDVQL